MSRPAAMPTDVYLQLQAHRSGAAPASRSSPAPEPTRVRGGTKAQRGGRSWEGILEQLLELQEKRGLLTWWRTPEPYKRLRTLDGGRFEGVPVGKGPPDYHVLSQGRAIAMEAKSTADARWALHGLQEHQAVSLDAYQRQKGCAVVALRTAHRMCVVPWSALGPEWWAWFRSRDRASPGTASLGEEDLVRLGAREMDLEGEWLSIARRAHS